MKKPKVYEYPCTECGGDAYIGYMAKKGSDWGGLVYCGERLCTACFKRRGGKPITFQKGGYENRTWHSR